MSNAGLSRRRVAQSSISNGTTSSDGSATTTTTPLPTPTASSLNGSTSFGNHAGTAMEGGNKIAFDPRDLESTDDSAKMPKLTIMEEILLLGLKDQQGYLSFWNDNISYALRGCILIELALRKRIAVMKDPSRRRFPLAERLIEVVDDRQTGETILDEALKMIKTSEKMGIGNWIDLMSGETWNITKISFQLKQVRERLAKGLVDKGVLRTEKRNFLLFDMATHPVADTQTKERIINRVVTLLTARTATLPPSVTAIPSISGSNDTVQFRVTRSVSLVCAAYAASVLDNALVRLGYDEQEAAMGRCDEILAEFSTWPFGSSSGSALSSETPVPGRKRARAQDSSGRESIAELLKEVKREMGTGSGGGDAGHELHFEIIATVLEVFSRMDSLWT